MGMLGLGYKPAGFHILGIISDPRKCPIHSLPKISL